MANQLLTISMITMEAMDLFLNENAFLKNVSKKLSSYFGKPDAQIGTTLNIRKRLDYTQRTGQVASPQSTNEQQVTLTINTQSGVDTYFTSQDLALSITDFSENVLRTQVNIVAAGVSSGLMSMLDTGVANLSLGGSQTNTGGVPYIVNNTAAGINLSNSATVHPSINSLTKAAAYLSAMGSTGNHTLILHPETQAALVPNMAGYFNPQIKLSNQWETGLVAQDTLGWTKILLDQTIPVHTVGAFGTLPTSNGATQTGSTINVTALNGPLNVGDVVSFGSPGTGIDYVNRLTKGDAGILGQFVVTQFANTGSTSISVYPPVIGPYANGAQQQYQTTTTSVANGTQLTSPIAASTAYYKNVGFNPAAIEAVFVKLPEQLPGAIAKTAEMDGASMRVAHGYNIGSDQMLWRLDVLWGAVLTRPEWCVILCDQITN